MATKHLNIFYSYDKGSLDDPDRRQQLENNVTRAFIITLKSLSAERQELFLRSLLETSLSGSKILFPKELCFELQDLSDHDKLHEIQRSTSCRRVMLTIGSKKARIDQAIFLNDNYAEIKKLNKKLDELEKLKFVNEIKGLMQDFLKHIDGFEELPKDDVTHLKVLEEKIGIKLDDTDVRLLRDKIEFIYTNILGSRPDAWIYGSDFAVLVESKVGTNPVYEAQIFRHLTHKNGFKISPEKVARGEKCTAYNLVNVSWGDIRDQFEKLNHPEQKLVSEFMEYLVMTGTVLDLSFVIKDKGYDREQAKEQFGPFLEEMDKRVQSLDLKPKLIRAKRPKDYLWDYYGVKRVNSKNKESASQDPHYSVYFDEDKCGIALTTKGRKLIRTFLKSKRLLKYLEGLLKDKQKSKVLLSRYSLNLENYRLIDHKPGQQKGETFSTFNFTMNMFEMYGKDKDLEGLIETMNKWSAFAKQIEIRFTVLYPNIRKIKDTNEEQLRSANKGLFENDKNLLDAYETFMKDTKEIFEELVIVGKEKDSG